MVHGVSLQRLNAKARVRFQASPYGICAGQSSPGTYKPLTQLTLVVVTNFLFYLLTNNNRPVFRLSTLVVLCKYSFTNIHYFYVCLLPMLYNLKN